MSSYEDEVLLTVKSIIHHAEILKRHSEDLMDACQVHHLNYETVYSTLHHLMDDSSSIDAKIGTLSMFLSANT